MPQSSSAVPQLPQLYFSTRPLSSFLNFRRISGFQEPEVTFSDIDAAADGEIGEHEYGQAIADSAATRSDVTRPVFEPATTSEAPTTHPQASSITLTEAAWLKNAGSQTNPHSQRKAHQIHKEHEAHDDQVLRRDFAYRNPPQHPLPPIPVQSNGHAGAGARVGNRPTNTGSQVPSRRATAIDAEDPDAITPAPRVTMPVSASPHTFHDSTRRHENPWPHTYTERYRNGQRRQKDVIAQLPAAFPPIQHSSKMDFEKKQSVPFRGEPKELRRVSRETTNSSDLENGDTRTNPSNGRSANLSTRDHHDQGSALLPPAPDGGWLAWSHAVFGALAIFNCWGLNLSFGVFEAFYKGIYMTSHSHATIAWIGSVQLFLIFFTAIIVGRCYDLGYARHFFHAGSVGLFLVILGTSWCKTWSQLFWVQGVLTGICMGCIFCSGVLVVGEYFSKNLGLAIGVGAAGSSIGGIAYTLMARSLLASVGFGRTMRYMSIMAAVTLIPSNVVFTPRRTRAVYKAILEQGKQSRNSEGISWDFIKDPAYLLMAWGMFFSFWGLYFGFYYVS